MERGVKVDEHVREDCGESANFRKKNPLGVGSQKIMIKRIMT